MFVAFKILSCVCLGLQEVNVKSGGDVTLKCQGPSRAPVEALKWTKPDLKSDHYVFFYRDDSFYKSYQHECYHDRVELRDPAMKDGDISVILKNVDINDAGIYECHISVENRAQSELRCIINLKVVDSGEF